MPNRIALISGVDSYADRSIANLAGAYRDAKRFADFLHNELPQEERFDVVLLKDPTFAQLIAALDEIPGKLYRARDALFIFYFAGHGTRYCGDNQVLLCSDATALTVDGTSEHGAVTPKVLARYKQNIGSNKFFCFDTCRSDTQKGRGLDSAKYNGSKKWRDALLKRSFFSRAQYCDWMLTSCADGERATDDGTFMSAMLNVMRDSLKSPEGIMLNSGFAENITEQLRVLDPRSRQNPTYGGRSFTLCSAYDGDDGSWAAAEPVDARVWETVEEPRPVYAYEAFQQLIGDASALGDKGAYQEAIAKLDEALALELTDAMKETLAIMRDDYAQAASALQGKDAALADVASDEVLDAARKSAEDAENRLAAELAAKEDAEKQLRALKTVQKLSNDADSFGNAGEYAKALAKLDEALALVDDDDWRKPLLQKRDRFQNAANKIAEEAVRKAAEEARKRRVDEEAARAKAEEERAVMLKAQRLVDDAKKLADACDYANALAKLDEALKLAPEGKTRDLWKTIRAAYEKAARERAAKDEVKRKQLAAFLTGANDGWGQDPSRKAGTLKTLTVAGVEYRFHWCPAGTFMMGSNNGFDDEKPIHEVRLTRGFWLLETPVIQRMWKSIMGNNPSYFKGDDLPVERVRWNDCKKFFGKITKKYRQENPNGPQLKFWFPTEAQWEYACRAGQNFKYSGSDNLDSVGWYDKNSGSQTHDVRGKAPNGWGFYDMSGNVWEWCADWYRGDYYNGGSMTDPRGPSSGSGRVYRGGGWFRGASSCRRAFRRCNDPGGSWCNVGFRLLLESVQ